MPLSASDRDALGMNAPPYKIKVVEPISLPDADRRRDALVQAGYNTFLLRSEDVFIDLLTDSGTGAVSQEQRAAMELGDESYAGSRSFFRLEKAVSRGLRLQAHDSDAPGPRRRAPARPRCSITKGQLVPSNLYFTTSREHAEMAGGIWTDVSIPEASDPASPYPWKGNIDVRKLEALIRGAGPENIAFVRQECCLNMAGGQPFSIENLVEVRAVTLDYNVPLILDATRSSENALFVKRREEGHARHKLPEIIKLIADLSDGAIFSSKKDHFVPIGGLVAVNDDLLAERLRELVVVYEGFTQYGGMSGSAMEALARGIYEAADERIVGHYVDQVAYLASLLQEAGVPIVLPPGAHAVFLDAKRFLPHVPQQEFPAQALAAAIYLAGGVRTMERGIVSAQHGNEPYDGLELVRLTLPRRVYTQEHLTYVAEVVADLYSHARGDPGPADDVRAGAPALLPGALRAAGGVLGGRRGGQAG